MTDRTSIITRSAVKVRFNNGEEEENDDSVVEDGFENLSHALT